MTAADAQKLQIGDEVRIACLAFINNATGRVVQTVAPSDTMVSVRYFNTSGTPCTASFFFDELSVA